MKLAVVIASCLLSLSSLAARATVQADVDAVEVAYGDLNLDRQAGVVTLYHRIKSASKRVCELHDGRTLVAKSAYATCVDDAVATAVARINRPMLSEYVARQSSTPVTDTPTRVAVR